MTIPSASDRDSPPSWRASMLAGLFVILARPGDWAVALAGFLARGGIVLFLLPIVVLPTPSGVANVVAPTLTPFLFGQVAPEFVALVAVSIGAVIAWIILGGLVGGWADLALVAAAAADEDIMPRPRSRLSSDFGLAIRAFLVRLIAHLPLGAVLVWGAGPTAAAIYNELASPFEVVTPLAIRILQQVPDQIVAMTAVWLVGEAAGGLAVRRLVIGRTSVFAAVGGGWLDLIRRPIGSLLTLILTNAIVVVAIGPGIVASAVAWSRLRFVVLAGSSSSEIAVALLTFVAVWLGGLVLAGGASAWRSAAWTAEWLRRLPVAALESASDEPVIVGTFGGTDAARPGGWPSTGSSGTL